MVDVFSLGQDASHKRVYELMTAHLENVAGLQPIHYLLYERAAFLYWQTLQCEDEKMLKVWLSMYIDVSNEIGRETRLYSKDENVSAALIYAVSSVLKSELTGHPDILNRITERLANL